jgi:N-acetylmuramoyl-L-alanine amidase
MQSKSKSYWGAAIAALIIGAVTYFSTPGDQHTFKHVNYIPKSFTHVIIDAGHGSIENGKYLTAGKQSPTWKDSLKIYEGYSNKLIALDLSYKLTLAHIDNTILNNSASDLTLLERSQKVSELFKIDSRLLLISLHHNAQIATNGDYTDFEGLKGFTSISAGGASGIEVYTSIGRTESDNFAENYLMPQLRGYLKDLNFRNAGKCKEANFHILKKTPCPAVLIEFLFMTTYTDCLIIADSYYRDAYTTALTAAILNYNKR